MDVVLPTPSWRIRGYLAIKGCLYLWFTLTYVVSADRLRENPTFDILEKLMPVEWFGVVFVALGILSLGGMVWPSTVWTRRLLGISAFVSVLFGLCLAFAGTWSPAAGAFIASGLTDMLLGGAPYQARRQP